jgi:hypothetical protein
MLDEFFRKKIFKIIKKRATDIKVFHASIESVNTVSSDIQLLLIVDQQGNNPGLYSKEMGLTFYSV